MSNASFRPWRVWFLVFLLGLGVISCAPTTRLVTKRCPAVTTAVLLDFFVGVGAMGVSALKERSGKTLESAGYSALGTVFIGGAYVSELSCLKK